MDIDFTDEDAYRKQEEKILEKEKQREELKEKLKALEEVQNQQTSP